MKIPSFILPHLRSEGCLALWFMLRPALLRRETHTHDILTFSQRKSRKVSLSAEFIICTRQNAGVNVGNTEKQVIQI